MLLLVYIYIYIYIYKDCINFHYYFLKVNIGSVIYSFQNYKYIFFINKIIYLLKIRILK